MDASIRHIICGAVIAVLAACSDGVAEADRTEREPIRIATAIALTRTQANLGDLPDTRLANGSLVDVYIKASDASENEKITSPTVYKAEASVLSASDEADIQYWPTTGTISVFAVSPAGANAKGEIVVQDDQSTLEKYVSSDLLFCNNQSGVSRNKTAPLLLTFRHALTKIVINLVSDDAGGNPNITNASVELQNVQRTAKFTPGTSDAPITASTVVSIPETATDAITLGTQKNTAYSFAGIIPPQTIYKQFVHATVTIKDAGAQTGKTYSGLYWTPDESISLQPGRCYTFNLSVTRNQILLREAIISPWRDAEDGTLLEVEETIS